MKYFVLSFLVFVTWSAHAAQRNLISVGQGISNPAITHNLFYSNGTTVENPTGIAFQNGFRISGIYLSEINDATDLNGAGGELGYGNGNMGLAIGTYQADCDDCEADVYGGFGATLDSVGFGLSASEDLYSAGLIINPKGNFKLGLAATFYDNDIDSLDTTAFGAGFSFSGSGWIFAVDASKFEVDSDAVNDDTIYLTPGFKMHFDFIYFSVNLNTRINEPEGVESDDDMWFGVGFGNGDPFNLTFYHENGAEFGLVGSAFF